ncbi:MAG: hypothetical protein WDN06_21695 [Asticcacaulis sp.]
MNNVALMYYNGDGGAQDRVMAAMWFRKAAERGIEDSQYNLGVLYQHGDGVAVNLSEALQVAVPGRQVGRFRSRQVRLQRQGSAVRFAGPEGR